MCASVCVCVGGREQKEATETRDGVCGGEGGGQRGERRETEEIGGETVCVKRERE